MLDILLKKIMNNTFLYACWYWVQLKFRKKERKTERKRENAAWIEIKYCTPFNHFKISFIMAISSTEISLAEAIS